VNKAATYGCCQRAGYQGGAQFGYPILERCDHGDADAANR